MTCENSYEPEMGARPIKRAIDKYIVDGLAQSMLEQRIDGNNRVSVSLANNQLIFIWQQVN